MRKYLTEFTFRVLEGEFDEFLEGLFNVTLAVAVLIYLAVFLILYQLGYLEYYSAALKPAAYAPLPIFPN